MKIIQITPGSGDNFYCENCLRDRELVKALRRQGHDVVMVPLYLPLQAEAMETITDVPIFFGGVNVYLQQKLGLFRKTPRWLDKIFDHTGLLAWASKKAGMTSARDLGETTISMLKGEEGRQLKELNRLVDWLALPENKPEVVIISNILLGGLAQTLKERLQVPLVCLLQDEEGFVDGLPEPYASDAWRLMQQASQQIDAFVAVSRTYADQIGPRLNLRDDQLHVIYMGLNLDLFQPAAAPPEVPTIGFLSRTCAARGLDILIEAFIKLKEQPNLRSCRLHISGGKNQADDPFMRDMQQRLDQAGVASDVSIEPEFLGHQRLEFLQGLSVMCVPEQEEAAYGLFALEALASGVPTVLPAIGVFPEMLALTGGGTLVEENTPEAFAAAMKPWLLEPEQARVLGQQGQAGMQEHFDVEATCEAIVSLLTKLK